MCYLKSISIFGFDLLGDKFSVTFGGKSLKAHEAAGAVNHVTKGGLDGILLGS